jgi:riboflavin synthase
MFTGLIEATGRIDANGSGHGRSLRVVSPLGAELTVGDSVAVNGVCLTVTAADAGGFAADVSPETLRVTTLGRLAAGRTVNLERPLRADARLGGHFVLGHVDGVGVVTAFEPDRDCHWLDVQVPGDLAPFLIPKGSIAIDGISLTIARLDETRVGVQIVPHTRAATSLGAVRVGDDVNIEADVLGKHVARLLGRLPGAEPAGVGETR